MWDELIALLWQLIRSLFAAGGISPVAVPTLATRPAAPSFDLLEDLLHSLWNVLRALFSPQKSRTRGSWKQFVDFVRANLGALVCHLAGGAALISCVVNAFLWFRRNGAENAFAAQLLLAGGSFFYVPVLSLVFNRSDHRIAAAVLECFAFLALIAWFTWMLGASLLNVQIGYAGLLVMLLIGGSHAATWYRDKTLARVEADKTAEDVWPHLPLIHTFFKDELIIYASVPLGLGTGLILGLGHETKRQIVFHGIQWMAGFFTVSLSWFVASSFRRMGDPLLRFDDPKLRSVPLGADVAYALSELRKVYLYDSFHNVTLLVSFVALGMSIWQIHIERSWWIQVLAGVVLLFVQIPFIAGQAALQDLVLGNVGGWGRAKLLGEMKEGLPLFPKIEFLAALISSGSAGGLVWSLGEKLIKGAE